MSFNDPISEFLTKIRNAQMARHRFVDISVSKMKRSLAKILRDKGYIANFIENEKEKKMRIFLKYTPARKGIINELKRVSKPGRRVYLPSRRVPKVLGGIGSAIVSTSQGVMDDEKARKLKIGGEILCYIW